MNASRKIQSAWRSTGAQLLLGSILGLTPVTVLSCLTVPIFRSAPRFCSYLIDGPHDFLVSSLIVCSIALATLGIQRIRKIGCVALLLWLLSILPAILLVVATALASDGCMGKL